MPQELAGRFGHLVAGLDGAIPAKQLDRNLILASWNLRSFGDLTEKWRSEAQDSPKRDLFDVRCIAEIVSRFDVVAIQEARGDLSALRAMLQALGEFWALIATDVARGRAGNNERMLFVFDQRRVRPSGLAGELVVAIETDTPVEATELDQQFARTPTLRGQLRNRVTRVHARHLARPLRRRPGRSSGLTTPDALNEVPRTIFDEPQAPHFYDQIAWFGENTTRSMLTLDFLSAGSFDFVTLLQGALTKTALSWRVSDHYPLWLEFSLREAA